MVLDDDVLGDDDGLGDYAAAGFEAFSAAKRLAVIYRFMGTSLDDEIERQRWALCF